ncbi:hypothetical protein P175DRAFT_0501148 [Aspergillus ochraceoroseus IBT 24754]|uniref:Uncharacterized protein n=1 Tax=Aspergillus ochraceoroseus IBT 24754 TaxID=1392256 RepID=A0A2T5LWB2_9EURO|nr:uncharacterized protein P175DRAFT_0501148 [Aspergillus ochraceoroseus IBT 24754]PTU20533.1 hypothetical protein P175DRAFT_0501148 [Aspergillus ochraceoroseus IBT 24754]
MEQCLPQETENRLESSKLGNLGLFDKRLEQDDWEWEDGIEVARDGLVYPKISPDGMYVLPSTAS